MKYVISYLKYVFNWVRRYGFKASVSVELSQYIGFPVMGRGKGTRVFLSPRAYYNEVKELNLWRQAARTVKAKAAKGTPWSHT